MGRTTLRAVSAGLIALLTVAVMAAPAGAASRAKLRKPGPLRVLLIGDSITVNYQHTAAELLTAKGYQVIRHGLAGTGLLDANQCRGQFAYSLLAYIDPDVVVFQNSGNYAIPNAVYCAPTTVAGSKTFYKQWKTAAKLNQKVLMSAKARFLWVLGPSVNLEPKRTMTPQINTIYRRIAGKRAGLIDAWTAFGGARFDQSLRYDEQHLNAAGSKKLADLVVKAITG